MPAIPSPCSLAKSEVLQDACKGALLAFSSYILINETPILSPTAGYKAYDKRMQFAKLAIQQPDLYKEKAATYIAMIDPEIELQSNANYRYLVIDNPTGQNAMQVLVGLPGWSGPAPIGSQLFDALAGVNASDLL